MKPTRMESYLDPDEYNDIVTDDAVREEVLSAAFPDGDMRCQACGAPEPEGELCLTHTVSIYGLAEAGVPRNLADDPKNLTVVCKPCLTNWKQPNPFVPGKLYLRSREYGYRGLLHGGFMAPGYPTLAAARKSLEHLKSSPHRTKPTDDVSIYVCSHRAGGVELRPIEGPQHKRPDSPALRFECKPRIKECKLVLEAIEKNALRVVVVDSEQKEVDNPGGTDDIADDFTDDEIEHKIAVAAYRSYRGEGFHLTVTENYEPDSLIRAVKTRCVEMIDEAA